MADDVRVAGRLYSFASVQLKINDKIYYGYHEIDWDEERARGKKRGSGRSQVPRGKTAGQYNPGTLKITFDADSVLALITDLASLASDGKSYGNAEFPVVVQRVEDGRDPVTDEFGEVTVSKITGKETESEEPDTQDVEFDFNWHKTNGMSLFDNTEGLY